MWNFFTEPANLTDSDDGKLTKIYHQTVKKVTNDFETLGFNTAIAQMMVFVNEVYKVGSCPRAYAEGFIKMISCIIPHVGEEIWQLMGHEDTIAFESWPAYDESKCAEQTFEIALQVNGKIRSRISVAADITAADALAAAKADEKVAPLLEGMQIIKELYVPGKLVNLVVKPQ